MCIKFDLFDIVLVSAKLDLLDTVFMGSSSALSSKNRVANAFSYDWG